MGETASRRWLDGHVGDIPTGPTKGIAVAKRNERTGDSQRKKHGPRGHARPRQSGTDRSPGRAS